MRLFVAFDIPSDHMLSIEKAAQPLRLAIPDARWSRRDGWHVTLKFLGEVEDDRVPDVERICADAVAKMSAVTVRLSGFGAFPTKRRARVIWVGLSEDGHELSHLAARLEKKLGAEGFRQESRPLKMHLTLARLREPRSVEKALESLDGSKLLTEPFPVEEIALFRSHLSPKGATYERLRAFGLGG